MLKKVLIIVYVLGVLVLSATAKADFSTMPLVPQDVKQIEVAGQLTTTGDGNFYLVTDNEQAFLLMGNFDFSSLDSEFVVVKSIEAKFQSKPVFEPAGLDPLHIDQLAQTQEDLPVLYVLGVEVLSR